VLVLAQTPERARELLEEMKKRGIQLGTVELQVQEVDRQ